MNTYRVWVAKTKYYFTEIEAEHPLDAQKEAFKRIDKGLELSFTNDDDECEIYKIEDINK